MISPVSGTVSEVNEILADEPQMMNESPYEAWFIKVTDISEQEELMDAEAYEAFIQEND